MSAPIDLTNPGRSIHVGVILMGGITEIMDLAPIDLLNAMGGDFLAELPDDVVSPAMKAQVQDIQIHWITENGDKARLTSNIVIEATHSFETSPPLDIALMGAHNFAYQPNARELAFIRKTYAGCTAFLAVCGGFAPLLQAGLLHGKTATAPRGMIAQLRRDAPGTDWVERRWARDGKIWTSGVLVNGLDMMRAFGMEVWGEGEGEGGLVQWLLKFGDWPVRDVDYKDDAVQL